MAFTLYLNLICALRSRHRLLARSEPFCSCTASCSQPPIPRASGLYRAPSAPGDRNCEAVPLGGPAVPLSPGVSLSMSTGWETGLSPSPSVRTPVKKKPLSDGVTDHSGTPDLVASADGQLHLRGGRVVWGLGSPGWELRGSMPLEPHHGHCGSAGQRERHGVAGMRPVRQRGLARG